MGKSYICLACRARLLLFRRLGTNTQQLRTLSSPAYTNPTAQPEESISSILGDNRRAVAAESETEDIRAKNGESASRKGSQSRIGRYSRKELKPEELLNQLYAGRNPSNRAAGRSSSPSKPNNHPLGLTVARNDTNSYQSRVQQRQQRFSQLPSEAHEVVQRFVNRVYDDEIEAWNILQQLQALCSKPDQHYNLKTLWTQNFTSCLSPLLWKLTARWLMLLQSGQRDDMCPSPSAILGILQALGLGVVGRRVSALWNVAGGIFEIRARGSFANVQTEQDGVEELMKLWSQAISAELLQLSPLKSQESTPNHDWTTANPTSTSTEFDWSLLPTIEMLKSQRSKEQKQAELDDMMKLFVSTPPLSSRFSESKKPRTELASSALLTLDILRTTHEASDSTMSESGRQVKHEGFVKLLESILDTVPTPTPYALISKISTSLDKRLSQAYRDAYTRLGLDAAAIPTPTPPEPSRPSLSKREQQRASIDNFTTINVRRLGRAMERQDSYLVEKIRREVSAFAGSQGNDPTVIPLELYEHLMMAFFSLRNLQSAMEIWDQISKSGYKLNVRTYTMMMRGAIGSRDLSGMQMFWTKMQRASILPDDHAWSVRIFGLIKMNHVRAGLQALNDMGNEWVAAARGAAARNLSQPGKHSRAVHDIPVAELAKRYPGPVKGVVKPTVVILNSAVSALALTADVEIPKVLSWGRLFGIEPNLTTYNALLNVAMRHSAPEEALNILHRMHEHGIEPDSTTWTVLLTSLFQSGFLNDLNAAEQQERILGFLNTLEDKDGKHPGVDDQGYALIIDRLLKQYDNPPAAEAVLKRLVDSGRKPTMHIYTILMTSYFQKQPQPDLAAIESLWRRITSENNGFGASLDSVFFDRMIEGYATYHSLVGIRPMLGFLERMTQEGKRPSWKALEQVARALAERGEWERLRSIVLDVRARLETSRGAFQHTGQRDFWDFVLSTGLLKDEGFSRPQDMLPREPRPSPLTWPAQGKRSLRMQ